jgi:predicted ATPase/DNA-binding SARP family transcriptional activator
MSIMDKGDVTDRVLSFSLLGPVSVLGENLQPLRFRSSRDMALLIYLATESGLGISTHRREKLMNLLWGDFTQESARVNLRQALYHLRKTAAAIPQPDGGESISFLLTDRQTVQVNQAYPIYLDVVEFTRQLKDHQDGWPQAVELYRGDFLSDFYLPDANPFEDWSVNLREKFLLLMLDALTELAVISLEDRAYLEVEHYARRQLELDRLRENAYRQLMTALARTGRRNQALVLFDSCRKLLKAELGVEPTAETVRLFEDIRSGELDRFGDFGEIDTGQGESIDEKGTPVRRRIVNLPIQPTPFVGRESELTKLDELISDPDIRLITIVGPGGIGKTRLAIAAGECQLRVESPFTDGVVFISLAPLDSPDQIIPTMAEALDFHFETGDRQTRTPRQQLFNFLYPKRLLIIMDNFEHLPEGVDLVTNLLSNASELVIMATSRERLHLHQEQVYPIQGLEFPESDEVSHEVQKIIEFSAVRFFLQCANRIQPNYDLTTGDIDSLYQICQLVEGMPLALELAASWVKMLSLTDIATEIRQSLAFLQAEKHDVPRRHWNMRAVFDGTWKRLTETERRVFSQISVFRGGFDRQAAQAVTNTSLPLLAGLADKSLLRYDKGEDRYRIHELLRQYAADKLAGSAPAEAQVRADHCEYYCRWLSEREAGLKGEHYRAALAAIESDIKNIHTAWSWAVANYKIKQIETATDSLGRIYELLGRYQEGEQAIREAVVVLQDLLPPYSAPEPQPVAKVAKLLTRLLTWQATFKSKMGMGERASQLLDEGLRLLDLPGLKDHDVKMERAFILGQLGYINRDFDFAMAYELLQESSELYRELGDQQQLADVLNVSGDIARFRAAFDEADRSLEECLAIRQELDDPRLIARTLSALSWVAFSQGNLTKGVRLSRQGYQAHQEAGGWESIAEGRLAYGISHYHQGQFGEALSLLQSTKDILEGQDHKPLLARATTEVGFCLLHLGKFKQAYTFGQRGLALFEDIGSYSQLDHGRFVQSWIALGICSTPEAERLGRQAVTGCQIRGDIRREGLSSAILGFTLLTVDNKREARAFLRRSLQIGHEIGAYDPLVFGLPIIALLLVDENQIERAVEIYSLVESHPIVSNSRWWSDVVRQEIENAGSSLTRSVFEAAKTRGISLDLWETAEALLNEFL